ncbi:hypothetical protein CCP3SC5AM1_1260008 [Gammaproteobacteria bacterium]
MAICKNCGVELKGRWKNFCSRKCGGFFYIKNHAKETSIERKVREWLETTTIPFKTQVAIRNITLADFTLGDKLVCYTDGDFWHSTPRRKWCDNRINQRLEKLGFIVVRVSETDINKDFNKVTKIIKEAYDRSV